MLKVLLIGAYGQLGSDIVRTKPDTVELCLSDIEDLDITNRANTISALKNIMPDLIINTAAYVRVDDAEDNTDEAFRINASGVKNLVDASNGIKSTILHISTDYVFDGEKKPAPYNENDAPNPLNAYGITKYAGELFVSNYATKSYIIRTASLYGKSGASGKGGNFVFTVLNRIKNGQAMNVVNDIHMSPTCAYDLAAEIWKLILAKKPYGLYHMTNSGHCSWYAFTKKIAEFSGYSSEIIPISHKDYPTKAKRPLWSPLTSVNGIKMRPWEEALKSFIRELHRVP